MTWHVSTDSRATGQKTYIGSTPNTTIGNNTTASATLSYSSLAPGSYTTGVQTTTASNWTSAIANSSNTFNPTTAGSSGGCSVA